jgi:hypothetical protein
MEDDDVVPYLLAIREWENWFIRAVISIPLLIFLAFILKYYLIEPYSTRMLEFDIEFESVPMKKGDRENILNYEEKWRRIRDGEEWI